MLLIYSDNLVHIKRRFLFPFLKRKRERRRDFRGKGQVPCLRLRGLGFRPRMIFSVLITKVSN